MTLIAAFFRLVRVLNLLFIMLTQLLFQFSVVSPMFGMAEGSPGLDLHSFLFLMASSVLIAAGGYIINDYFDVNIDRINKPGKMVVGKIINRRWAIIWHWIFSLLGVMAGFYVGWRANIFWIGISNFGCVILLWLYSTTFKKKLLTGNLLISLLTSWVVLVVGFATHYRLMQLEGMGGDPGGSRLLRFTFLYGGFAFIISLIREVIKDMEDMPGDARYGATTMPIVWGVRTAAIFAGTWLTVLSATLLIVFAYVLQLGWWVSATYCLLFILIPLFIILRLLIKARTTADYGVLSNWIKLVMFTGILSMAFLSS